jgi:hypothetical protein
VRTHRMIILALVVGPCIACTPARRRSDLVETGIRFPACYLLTWDSMAIWWESSLIKTVRLTTDPSGELTPDSLPAFRVGATFYDRGECPQPPHSPACWDSLASFPERHPLWVQRTRDSIDIYIFGRVELHPHYIRARLTEAELTGSLGYTGLPDRPLPFRPLMTFVAPRRPCDSSVPSN